MENLHFHLREVIQDHVLYVLQKNHFKIKEAEEKHDRTANIIEKAKGNKLYTNKNNK